MRRFLRAFDARLVFALVFLLVAGTICWGFVQRGRHITEAERSVTELSSQVASLLDDNKRLNRQLARSERAATERSERAAKERDALQRELLRLINFLRESGIDVPLGGSRYTVPEAVVPETQTASSSPTPQQPQSQSDSGSNQPPSQPQNPGQGQPPSNPDQGNNGGGNNPQPDNGVDVDAGPVHIHVPLPVLP